MHCKKRTVFSSSYIPAFIFVILCLFPHPLISQENGQEELPDDGSSIVEMESGSGLSDARQLVRETIYLDITTASYYELQDWLLRLGLETSGTREQLENRLLTYYRDIFSGVPLTSVQTSAEPGKESDRMEIESAGDLQYEKDEEGGELIRLSGGVLLHMRDADNNTLHTVEAQSLIFNRSQNTVSAIGNVRYRMEKDNTEQDFQGQEITFDIENFRGVFIQGMSSRSAKIEEQPVTFYFKGTTIYRIQRDVLRLEEGIISSSKIDDPYYRIAAGNVWILGIDEWAIRDATLYIGHVPLVYIPFYYHPGDTFVFHPSIGMRSLEGYYAQTTTYFFGRQPETGDQGGRFSFLQAVEGDRMEYAQELRGFFLHSTRDPLEQNWINRTDSYGKFQLDYYTRLGLLAAVKLDMQELGSVKNLDLTIGAGYTNYIYELSGYSGTYTSLQYDTDTGSYIKNYQQPYVFGMYFPVRFGFDLDLEIEEENFGFNLELPFYSDRLLRDQLNKRNETLEWSRFLTGEGMIELNTFEEFDDPRFLQHTTFNCTFLEKISWIDTFRIDKLDTLLVMDQDELDEDDQALNKIGYYYPDVFTPLDFELSVRGTLFSTGRDRPNAQAEAETAEEAETGKPAGDYRAPDWREESFSQDLFPLDLKTDYRIPGPVEDIPLIEREVDLPFTHSLTYAIEPDFSYHTQYDPLYSYIYTDGNARFTYDAAMMQGRFEFTQSTRLKGRYRDHFNGEEADLIELKEDDKELSYFEVIGITELTNYFWKQRPVLSGSYIGYEIESDLYTYSYDEAEDVFESRLPGWDEESIQTHRSSLGLVYTGWEQPQKFVLTYTMPPRLQKIETLLDLYTGPLRSTVEFEVEEAGENQWNNGPLEVTETLTLFNQSSVSQNFIILHPESDLDDTATTEIDMRFIPEKLIFYQEFSWNISADRPENSITSLQTGWWTNRFEMRYTDNYSFDKDAGWLSTGAREFQPYRFSSQLEIPYQPEPFWKNRVELESALSATLQLNMIRYNESLFQLSWDTSLSIAEFLDLNLSIKSANNAIFRYIPAYSEAIDPGLEPLNLFDDLIRSINFFNRDDREASNFNLQSISFSLIHYMRDWRLQMQYSGVPKLDKDKKEYQWYSEFSIFVQWNPIPEIRKDAEYDEDGLRI